MKSRYLFISRIVNNDLASTVSKYPKRFVGLGTIPMQAPELAVEEMKRAAIDLKMPGFQIGSHVGDWNLDAKELYPIYKTAEELGTMGPIINFFDGRSPSRHKQRIATLRHWYIKPK